MEPASRKKKWGGRTQWSKDFFDMLPTLDVTSTEADPVVMKPKKQLKKDELAITTRWQCRRCRAILHPPMDPHTQRPALAVLADHLEGRVTIPEAMRTPERLPRCTAETLLTYGVAGSADGVASVRVSTHVEKRPRDDETDASTTTASRRAELDALLFPSSSSTSGRASASQLSPRVFVVVENPKTPRNLGSILRAMHNYGCDVKCAEGGGALIYSGTRLDKALSFSAPDALATDTVDGARHLPRLSLPSLQVLFDVLHAHTCACAAKQASDGAPSSARSGCPLISVVAVDLIEKATCLPFFAHPFAQPPIPHMIATGSDLPAHAPLVFYLFGPEDGTLSDGFLQQCDAAVYMPTTASMNLAASVNVLLYDRTAKAYVAAGQACVEGTAEYQGVFSTRNANNRLQWNPAKTDGIKDE